MVDKKLRDLLLQAPDHELDACMFPLIEKWDDPATALQILEVVDWCIFCSLCSGFTLRLLQFSLDYTIQKEGTTHEELVKRATWRTNMSK